jgi:hypothetical protein
METQQTATSGMSGVTTTTEPTEYIVLRQDVPDGTWKLDKTVKALSAQAAIRTVVGKPTEKTNGTYVAVPARSWKPTKVTAKVETKLALEDA